MFMCHVTKMPPYARRVILFTVNYCLFANGDVSIRFNGKDYNVVLEYIIILIIIQVNKMTYYSFSETRSKALNISPNNDESIKPFPVNIKHRNNLFITLKHYCWDSSQFSCKLSDLC